MGAASQSSSEAGKNNGFSCIKVCQNAFKRTDVRRRGQVKRTVIWVVVFMSLICCLDYFSSKWGQNDIKIEFAYPLNIPNFPEVVEEFRYKVANIAFTPINYKYSTIEYLHKAERKQDEEPHGLLIVVKSAINNFGKREAIRQTWGQSQYLRKTRMSKNLITKLVFICGVPPNGQFDSVEDLFPHEWMYNDIVVADFVDSYGNNTFKSMLAIRWAQEFKSDFQYLFVVDDDMYIDLVNLIRYVGNFPNLTFEKRHNLPGSQFPFYKMSTIYNKNHTLTTGNNILQTGVYMGQVYWNAIPLRKRHIVFKARKEEWNVPLQEYSYNYYPPYAPGCAVLLSKEAVSKFFYAAFFTEHFKIDDIYLGILAKKLGIIPVHNPHFFAWYPKNKLLMEDDSLSEAIAIHGCQCTAQMVDLWMNRNISTLIDCKSDNLFDF